MRTRPIWMSLILPWTTGLLLAGGFWDKVPYTEWSEKQIHKILNDSPWAKKVSMGGGQRPPGSGGFSAESQDRGPGGGFGGGSGLPGSGSAGRQGGSGAGGGRGGQGRGGGGPGMTLVIRWESARPLKQARLLNSEMAKQASAQEIEQYLSQEDATYIVSVGGLPNAMLERIGPDRLAERTSLVRKGHDPIQAQSAQLLGQEQALVLFFFPKADEILLSDKEVEFVLQLQRSKIRKKFKLKDLLFQDALAI